jgi:hypothetical protein
VEEISFGKSKMSVLEGLKNFQRRDVVVHLIGKTQVGKLTTKTLLESFLRESLHIISRLDASPLQNVSVMIGAPPLVVQEDIGRLVLCLFDISDADSFKVAEKLLQPLRPRQKITKVLVGNKIDLEYWRRVGVGSGVRLATVMDCKYCEISAHVGMHVDLLVDMVFREMFVGVSDEVLSDVLTSFRSEFQLIVQQQEDQMREIEAAVEQLALASKIIGSSISSQKYDLDELENGDSGIGGLLEKEKAKSRKKKSKPTDSLNLSTASKRWGPKEEARGGVGIALSPLSAPTRVQSGLSGRSSRQDKKITSTSSSLDLYASPPPPAPALPPPRSSTVHAPSANMWGAEDEFEEAQEAISPLQVDASSSVEARVTQRQAVAVSDLAELSAQLELSQKLDSLELQVVDLTQQSLSFKRAETGSMMMLAEDRSQKKGGFFFLQCVVATACCPCLFVVFVFESLKDSLRELSKKTALFDNVLADTENAFQSLAMLLVFLKNWTWRSLPPCLYFVFGGILNFLSGVLSFLIVLSSTIILILPSFFTLLIIRTSTVEKESKAFGGELFTLTVFLILLQSDKKSFVTRRKKSQRFVGFASFSGPSQCHSTSWACQPCWCSTCSPKTQPTSEPSLWAWCATCQG